MDEKHTTAYRFLQDNLRYLGKTKPFGSALRSKAFHRGHDFDIGLFTCFQNKDFLIKQIKKVSDEWNKRESIILHVFVIGSFVKEIIRADRLIIHFVPKWDWK